MIITMTKIISELTEPAIRRGIKTVGIGKKGSKPLDLGLISEILQDLQEGNVSPLAQGAFFAALVLKGITEEERKLEQAFTPGTLQDKKRLVEAIAFDAPGFMKNICVKFLEGKTIDRETAYQLGKFLLSTDPGDGARGIAASALRVRYETPEEYEGLLLSLQESIEEPFREKIPSGDPIIQLAEPFDGVDHSYLITPLLANHFQTEGHRVIQLVGRNSGPKFGNNLLDLGKALNGNFLKSNSELVSLRGVLSNDEAIYSKKIASPKKQARNDTTFGWFINQEDLSTPLNRWVELRREIIKRPFFSTLEKFLNPLNADILVTSAFHPPYTEKMITVAERAGFPGAIVIRNGLEGTLAFALKRPVKMMCSARQKDGSYQRHEFEFDAEQFLEKTIPVEEKLEAPSLEENARLIQTFQTHGRTDNELFDARVKASCEGLSRAIEWIKKYYVES